MLCQITIYPRLSGAMNTCIRCAREYSRSTMMSQLISQSIQKTIPNIPRKNCKDSKICHPLERLTPIKSLSLSSKPTPEISNSASLVVFQERTKLISLQIQVHYKSKSPDNMLINKLSLGLYGPVLIMSPAIMVIISQTSQWEVSQTLDYSNIQKVQEQL